MELKALAGRHAAWKVASGMRLGLGTGSTMRYVLEALAERLREGSLVDILGVPTSSATERQCQQLGIPLTSLEMCPTLDLAIDGADEIAPTLDLIKGLGGALLREKIVARASKAFLVVADASKQVDRLGTRCPLPVEVIPFGWNTVIPFLEQLGANPTLRLGTDQQPYSTDNRNLILDCTFPAGIPDPHTLAQQLDSHPVVMGHGLFLGMATAAVIAYPDGIRELVPTH